MPLPSSGVMKASMIMQELKQSSSPWSINAKASRDLAKVPSGTIKFSDFYGKSNISPFILTATFTTNRHSVQKRKWTGSRYADVYTCGNGYGYGIVSGTQTMARGYGKQNATGSVRSIILGKSNLEDYEVMTFDSEHAECMRTINLTGYDPDKMYVDISEFICVSFLTQAWVDNASFVPAYRELTPVELTGYAYLYWKSGSDARPADFGLHYTLIRKSDNKKISNLRIVIELDGEILFDKMAESRNKERFRFYVRGLDEFIIPTRRPSVNTKITVTLYFGEHEISETKDITINKYYLFIVDKAVNVIKSLFVKMEVVL